MDLQALPTDSLASFRERIHGRYQEFRARGFSLNMARGKPSEEQLSLAQELLALPGKQQFYKDAMMPERGRIALPTAPGLGYALDDAKIEARTPISV